MKSSQFQCVFLITTLSIFCSSIIPLHSQCLEDQKTMLIQLKNSLNFHPSYSTKLVLWNHNTDCCKWGGVTCDDEGHVIGLNLSDESIFGGGIHNSSSLFGLRYLQSLNLAFNNFNSAYISSEFEKLTSLAYLNLSCASLVGEIPIEISRLTRLVSLDLSSTSFSESVNLLETSNLKLLVQNLTKLTQLHLDFVYISSKGDQWCKAISSSLPNLRVLSLFSCGISGPLCSSLENLRSLSVIELSDNYLSTPVPNFFANFTNLTNLHLSSCNLQGTFPEKIFHISTLRTLDLSSNELLEGSLSEFPPNGSLQSLYLISTKFSGRLPNSIGNLRMLSTVDLSRCNFSGPIPNSMASLTQLVYLDLSWNMLTGPIPSFSMSKNLTYINLSGNSLSGGILSSHFEGLSNLEEIDLSFNSLNGSIPSSLLQLPSLKKIQLSNNRFGGEIEEFCNASSSLLESIDLGSNNLQGTIPMPFFELARLTMLLLASNNFSLQLETVYKLSNLTILDLSYNSLSIGTSATSSSLSSIPMFQSLYLVSCNLQCFPDLRNQPRLYKLDLSDNQIDGKIPNWIWEVGIGSLFHLNLSHNLLSGFQEPYVIPTNTLEILDLHSNQLRGEIPIPSEFISYVDLSSNNFSSSIPANIGSIPTTVQFFSLSNTSLIGNIPQSICNMSFLQVLDLSTNRLSGTIPSCLITRSTSTLGVLNLRNNKLSGTVLNSFPSSCTLQSLDLSVNHLEGRVPKSLVNCKEIEVLNLGKNNISDRFPCFLNNISSLHVLILHSNRFQGDISCQGGNINDGWLNLQIIDLAFNNFGGVLPSNFFSNWKTMMIDKDNAQSKVNTVNTLEFQLFKYSYQIAVIYKGFDIELVKVLTIFTSIDLSSNRFDGKIPDSIGNLKSLVLLNLSHNALTASIPTSLENLKQLESLDLSQNMLNGMIPAQLASLTFLSVLNLSYNLLVGKIPTGSQIQTFSETSFLGNKGLCGFPLNTSCNNTEVAQDSPPILFQERHSLFETQVYLSAELGFFVGLGIIIWPLVFCRRWRQWYYEHVDRVFLRRILQRRAYRNPIRRL